MMRHLILGAGNLGCDLHQKLTEAGQEVVLMSGSRGLDLTEFPIGKIAWANTIWCAIGHGSVNEAKSDPGGAIDVHVTLPAKLMKWAHPDATLVFFSSDYALSDDPDIDRPRSFYGLTKLMLETLVSKTTRRGVYAIRVTSLYGRWKPERCFPGKLVISHPEPGSFSLPKNQVKPTPTEWLAEELVSLWKQNGLGMFPWGVAPSGIVSVAEWGARILGPDHTVFEGGFDYERPLECPLQPYQNPAPHWLDLWAKYGAHVNWRQPCQETPASPLNSSQAW